MCRSSWLCIACYLATMINPLRCTPVRSESAPVSVYIPSTKTLAQRSKSVVNYRLMQCTFKPRLSELGADTINISSGAEAIETAFQSCVCIQ